MKMLQLKCKKCGATICCDAMVLAAQAPVHCPQCDAYIASAEYQEYCPAGATVPNLVKPSGMTDAEVGSIIYRPAEKR